MNIDKIKEETIRRWESMNLIQETPTSGDTLSSGEPIMFPLVKQVFAKLNDVDLVSVKPLSGSHFDEEAYQNEKRKRLLDSILDDEIKVDYDNLEKLKEKFTEEWGMPIGKLFYMDFKYETKEEKIAKIVDSLKQYKLKNNDISSDTAC